MGRAASSSTFDSVEARTLEAGDSVFLNGKWNKVKKVERVGDRFIVFTEGGQYRFKPTERVKVG